jgi:hypothetical protein
MPLSRLREREGPAKREGEGLLLLVGVAEDPHPALSRERERV